MTNVEYVTVYLTAVIAFVSLILSLINYFSQQNSANQERVHDLSDRIYEIDRVYLEFPDLFVFLDHHENRETDFFVESTKHDEIYFRIWGLIDYHLNLFDEIVSLMERYSFSQRVLIRIFPKSVIEKMTWFFTPALQDIFEYESWKTYMLGKMHHPLFREFYERNHQNYGDHLLAFVNENRSEIGLCENLS